MKSRSTFLALLCLFFYSFAFSQDQTAVVESSNSHKGILALSEDLHPEWGLGFESDFYFELSHLPSSRQGRSAFEFSELKLDPRVKLNEQIGAYLRFSLADERSNKTNNYTSQLENAYIQFKTKPESAWVHEVGLIRPYWHRHEGLIGQVDIFGLPSKSLARRYRFMGLGDLGYQGRYDFSQQAFAVFGVVNGEENSEGENGASKEGFLGYIFDNQNRLFGIWLSHGRVDVAETEVADKNRAHLRYQSRHGRFALGVEGMWAQDASSDIENQRRAEEMTFAELPTVKNITTYAGSFEAQYQLSDRNKALIRYDLLRPDLKNKDVESWMAGWIHQEQAYMSWGMFYENTLFGTQHSAQSRQRERVRLGLNLGF